MCSAAAPMTDERDGVLAGGGRHPDARDELRGFRDGYAAELRALRAASLDASSDARDSRAMDRAGHVRPRGIFGVATALGCFSAFQAYYYVSTFTDWPASLPLLLALNLGYWYSWAVLTPAILWLARWAPFERRTWKRALAVHVPGVFVATIAHIGLTV